MILSNFKDSHLSIVKGIVRVLYPECKNFDLLVTETPKNHALGDVAIPLFPIVKEMSVAPNVLSAQIVEVLREKLPETKASGMGAYLNMFLEKKSVIKEILTQITKEKSHFYKHDNLKGQKIMLEFSSPNTNKPLHLGHMRNNCLGESLSRILKNCGAEVFKVNIVNNRGVHICKSMLAYQRFGEGKTPESEGLKSDHFVGHFYVQFSNWAAKDPEAENLAQKMLLDWEAGVPEVLELWEKMNDWALSGIQQSYQKCGISFDKYYFESDTYKLGRDLIFDGLKQNIFFKAEDGSIRLDVSELGKTRDDESAYKVLLRSDGTSVYISQDLGTAVERYRDFPFDRLIYVVANEQQRHFQLLFYALRKLGYSWADALYHLSYGMVNLPDGKMKSREGTVVDADDLISSMEKMAKEEIEAKDHDRQVDPDAPLKIALAAIHYYLLQVSPVKDMTFDSKESLSFNGNTGPYLQYTVARAHSLLEKEEAILALKSVLDTDQLNLEEEWQIVKLLDEVSDTILQAAIEYAPSLIVNKLYDLAKLFNKYYHDVSILSQQDQTLVAARCFLVQSVEICLRTGLELLNIPVVDHM